jgi:hypothetical protein
MNRRVAWTRRLWARCLCGVALLVMIGACDASKPTAPALELEPTSPAILVPIARLTISMDPTTGEIDVSDRKSPAGDGEAMLDIDRRLLTNTYVIRDDPHCRGCGDGRQKDKTIEVAFEVRPGYVLQSLKLDNVTCSPVSCDVTARGFRGVENDSGEKPGEKFKAFFIVHSPQGTPAAVEFDLLAAQFLTPAKLVCDRDIAANGIFILTWNEERLTNLDTGMGGRSLACSGLSVDSDEIRTLGRPNGWDLSIDARQDGRSKLCRRTHQSSREVLDGGLYCSVIPPTENNKEICINSTVQCALAAIGRSAE